MMLILTSYKETSSKYIFVSLPTMNLDLPALRFQYCIRKLIFEEILCSCGSCFQYLKCHMIAITRYGDVQKMPYSIIEFSCCQEKIKERLKCHIKTIVRYQADCIYFKLRPLYAMKKGLSTLRRLLTTVFYFVFLISVCCINIAAI